MTHIVITSIDLAKGTKAANLDVPPTLAEVILKNPPGDLLKAIKQHSRWTTRRAGVC